MDVATAACPGVCDGSCGWSGSLRNPMDGTRQCRSLCCQLAALSTDRFLRVDAHSSITMSPAIRCGLRPVLWPHHVYAFRGGCGISGCIGDRAGHPWSAASAGRGVVLRFDQTSGYLKSPKGAPVTALLHRSGWDALQWARWSMLTAWLCGLASAAWAWSQARWYVFHPHYLPLTVFFVGLALAMPGPGESLLTVRLCC